jgi:hypothetical protein
MCRLVPGFRARVLGYRPHARHRHTKKASPMVIVLAFSCETRLTRERWTLDLLVPLHAPGTDSGETRAKK